MTPSEILLKFKAMDSADFLSELEGEDLWGFVAMEPLNSCKWVEYPVYQDIHSHVVAELRREVAADLDVWMNLARSDLKIKQERIDELEIHWGNQEPIGDRVTREIIEYLKERQVK